MLDESAADNATMLGGRVGRGQRDLGCRFRVLVYLNRQILGCQAEAVTLRLADRRARFPPFKRRRAAVAVRVVEGVALPTRRLHVVRGPEACMARQGGLVMRAGAVLRRFGK